MSDKLTYRELVQRIRSDREYAEHIHRLVRIARGEEHDGVRDAAEARRELDEQFYVSEDELMQLGLNRNDVNALQCSNNTTFVLVNAARILDEG